MPMVVRVSESLTALTVDYLRGCLFSLATYGKYDTVIRGCTATQPTAGCYSSDESPGKMVCIGVCSTDLCNAAVSLTQSAVVRVLAAVGFLVVVANFRRK